MGVSKEKPVKQHDPTPAERDEKVSLHGHDPKDVLRRLLAPVEKDEGEKD